LKLQRHDWVFKVCVEIELAGLDGENSSEEGEQTKV